MRKNLLALSIAAMVGGLSGAANAQAVTVSTIDITGGGRVIAPVVNTKPGNNFGLPKLAEPTARSSRAGGDLVAANELKVAPEGIGHILFVPYFSTQGANATLLNLVNTDTVNGKAVKLRVRGAANSDDLFDITIYLSPGDMWTANISASAGGLSQLSTTDNSCTLPSSLHTKTAPTPFMTGRVSGDVTQTREGYIEILNMADVPPNSWLVDAANVDGGKMTPNSLFTAIKHVKNAAGQMVAPCTEGVMNLQANQLTTSATDSANWPGVRGYSWPTGGLMANWTLVNVADTVSFSGEAVALAATFDGIHQGAAAMIWSPQVSIPVNPTEAVFSSADPLFGSNADGKAYIRASSFDFPDMSTPYLLNVKTPSEQVNKVADALATKSITNEFLTSSLDDKSKFATDWMFSMPTRRYAVALDYPTKTLVENNEYNKHGVHTLNPAYDVTAPTALKDISNRSKYFRSTNASPNVSLNAPTNNRICVDAYKLTPYDRNEALITEFVVSPSPLLQFCGETTVLTFNSPGVSLLNAALATIDVSSAFADGWFRIDTPGILDTKLGLPIVGFAAAKIRGGSNLGGTWTHRTQR